MGDSLGDLHIGQWNLNSWFQRKNEVESLLANLRIDVFVMNDTRCCDTMGLDINGFEIERSDHPDNSRRPGGSAIAIRESISYKRIPTSTKESVCVEVTTSLGEFRITTVYAHPGELICKKLIDEAGKDASPSTSSLLIGDFNAHIGLDNDKDADRAGIHLIDLMNHYDFHLLNNDEPTYSSCSCSSMSCIDLAFFKCESSTLRANWEVLEPGSSDHLATLVSISSLNMRTNVQSGGPTISITDWDLYRSGLEDALATPISEPRSCSEIDDFLTDIEFTIKQQLEMATIKIKVMKKDDLILSKESRCLIELRRSMLKFRRANRHKNDELTRKILNRLSYDIKNQIKKDKDSFENERANAVMRETNPAKKWKLFKNFTGQNNKNNKIGDIIDLNNIRQQDNQAKANSFAEKLKISHSYPSSPNFDAACEQNINSAYFKLMPLHTPFTDLQNVSAHSDSSPIFDEAAEKITINEIRNHLKGTNSKSSCGPDKISYKHLKEGGEKLLTVLCYLYNILLVSGYFPLKWRKVDVKMLHKAGKPKLPVANYRPISLSSCLSKLFENCVKSRFEKKLSRVRKENLRQSAYKKKRGTQENVLKLTEDVVNAFNKRECVLGVFLDVSGAFDKVWKEGLVIKIVRWGVGLKLTRIISNFLTSRSLVIKVGDTVSTRDSSLVSLLAGTPQGSVLSPILFNSYMDDLWQLIPDDVKLLQYADDICIYATGNNPAICASRVQETLMVIERWAGIWRISMAPEKSNWILFSRCSSHKKSDIVLNMNNHIIPNSNQIKFLGIHFDEKMTWKAHLDKIIGHATAKAVQIQSLSAKNRFNSPTQSIAFFNSVVKPIFDYGAIVFLAIPLNQWKRIDKFHGKFLRSICGLPKCCSYSKLCDQLQQDKLSIQIKDQAACRIAGICSASPYAAAWMTERGFEWERGLIRRVSTHAQYDVYRSPVELALERHIQLGE